MSRTDHDAKPHRSFTIRANGSVWDANGVELGRVHGYPRCWGFTPNPQVMGADVADVLTPAERIQNGTYNSQRGAAWQLWTTYRRYLRNKNGA